MTHLWNLETTRHVVLEDVKRSEVTITPERDVVKWPLDKFDCTERHVEMAMPGIAWIQENVTLNE